MSYNRLVQIDGKVIDKSLKNKIKSVEKNSPAYKVGIRENDFLIKINDTPLKDIIDYKFLTADESFSLTIKRIVEDEIQEIIFDIEKDAYEDLGIEFMSGLIDKANNCSNNCIFCFIDQLPEGMRESMYFKDDDSRLSFLQGNFVTLTNMTNSDIKRIIDYKISPINISVHTTNPELRVKMLNNRNAGNVFERMKLLKENSIRMNAQIVLVRDYNDGAELDRTIEDLKSLYPMVQGVAVVPLGLTKFRDNLPKLTPFDKESSKVAINQIEKISKKLKEEIDTNFVRAADEFYVMAGLDVPQEDYYEGYEQIEDGIGMIRLFRESTTFDLEDLQDGYGEFTFVTGSSAYIEIDGFVNKLISQNPKIKANTYKVINDFFGDSITVAGLLTGKDVINNLKDKEVYKYLIMPRNMFRAGEDVMLDDIKIEDIERELSTKVIVVDYTGEDLIKTINGKLEGV